MIYIYIYTYVDLYVYMCVGTYRIRALSRRQEEREDDAHGTTNRSPQIGLAPDCRVVVGEARQNGGKFLDPKFVEFIVVYSV